MNLFSFILFATISNFIGKGSSLLAYDCENVRTKIKEISLLETQECNYGKLNITKTPLTIQIVQPKVFDEVEYFQCLIEVTHTMGRCGKSWDTFTKKGIYQELYELDRFECWDLIKYGKFKYVNQWIYINKAVELNFVSVMTIGSMEGSSCTPGDPLTLGDTYFDRPLRNSAFRIFTKQAKGTIDLEDAKLITEEGVKCNYHEESCLTASGGFTYWKTAFDHQNTCSEGAQFLAIYEGPATKIVEVKESKTIISYVIHQENFDYQVITIGKNKMICGMLGHLTEHPKLAVIERIENFPFHLKYNPNSLGKNINLMTYLNSKLVYTMNHLKEQIESLYKHLSMARCQAEIKLIKAILGSASSSPHEFAYQYTGLEGHTAATRGEVVYLLKCQPISVNFTQTEFNECYDELPVKVNGKLRFLSPKNHLISDVGTKVECSNILPVKYKFMNEWYSVHPSGLMHTTSPSVMSISNSNDKWKFKDIKNFAESGVYTQSELDRIDKIILSSIKSEAITFQMTRALQGETTMSEGLSIKNMMTINELKEFGQTELQKFFNNIYNKLGIFGNIVSTILGCVILLKGGLFLLNSIINFKLLKDLFGLSWKLLFFWWENLVHVFIHSESAHVKEKSLRNKKIKNNKIVFKDPRMNTPTLDSLI